MSKKEFYTPMEKVLIEGIKVLEDTTAALELDLMLLEMEAKANMMDGVALEEWVL